MPSAPFFVVNLGRSGSTLLRMMLTHHPRIAVPYESGFLTSYQDRAAEFGPLEDDGNLRRLIEAMLAEPNLRRWDHRFSADSVAAAVRHRSVAGVAESIYADYAAGKGKVRWGDKSDYLDRMHVVHQMFPTAQFIHLVRDGRDVALSVMKLPWGPNDVVGAAEWWSTHVLVARRVGAVLGPEKYLEVQYERLVANPEAELRRCCAFLGEAYSPAMLDYAADAGTAIPPETRDLHHGIDSAPYRRRAFAWKREMHPADVALFNRHAHRMLGELGYEVTTPAVGRSRLAMRYAIVAGRRLMARAAVA
jgi:hypothetical protein